MTFRLAVAVAAALFSFPALAQEAPAAAAPRAPQATILMVDQAAVLRQSKAGRSVIEQLEAMQKTMEGEFSPEEKRIRDDAQALQNQAAVLAANVREQRQKDIRDRQQALLQKVQERQGELQGGFNKARAEIQKALQPVLQQILIERGGNIMFDRSVIVLGAADIDVTAVAIERLDQVLPTVKVELVPVAQQGGQGAPGPVAAPAQPQ